MILSYQDLIQYKLKQIRIEIKRMMIGLLFFLYFVLMILIYLYLGINMIRIRDKLKTHPKIICSLLPFLIHFIAIKYLFMRVPPFFSTLFPAIIFYVLSKRLENVRIFGLTGGIATGKSTLVRQIKQSLVIEIIDCDEISRKLSRKGNSGYKLIMRLLGDEANGYLLKNGELNREKFSDFVFQNPNFRRKLTKEMGKLIMWAIFKKIVSNILNKKYAMIIDAPILYETKILEYICYPVVVVGCPQLLQIKRLCKRQNYTQEEAIKRIKSQMPLSQKKMRCQIYISNEGTQKEMLGTFLTKSSKYIDKNESMTYRNAPL